MMKYTGKNNIENSKNEQQVPWIERNTEWAPSQPTNMMADDVGQTNLLKLNEMQ